MITVERLKEYLHYDPETGVFTWIKAKKSRKPGDVAGYAWRDKGLYIWLDNHGYRAHRLAWLYMTGAWPELQVDHRDRDPYNNRWTNLRQASPAQNSQNTKRAVSKQSGIKGVSKIGSRWRAQLQCEGKLHIVGMFDDIEAAAAAVKVAREQLHGDFACHE